MILGILNGIGLNSWSKRYKLSDFVNMELIVKTEKKIIKVILKEKQKVIDEVCFVDEHNLTENLLKSIDILLKKNKFIIADVKKVKVETDSNGSLTSERIIRTIIDSINWANKRGKNAI
jgi:hypothetical protein